MCRKFILLPRAKAKTYRVVSLFFLFMKMYTTLPELPPASCLIFWTSDDYGGEVMLEHDLGYGTFQLFAASAIPHFEITVFT